jgi:hypothetical protein
MARIYTRDSFTAPSVTTFLGAVNKPALVNWSARVEREAVIEAAKSLYETLMKQQEWMTLLAYEGSLVSYIGRTKAHQKVLAEAGDIGSEIHDLIDWETRRRISGLGATPGQRPKARPVAELAFQKWLTWADKVKFQPVYIEQPVWNKKECYAGRIDFTAHLTIDGVTSYFLGDYKSGKSIYIEALMQVAAYREAIREMGHKVPDKAVIVRLPKNEADPDPEQRILEAAELDEHFETFKAVQHLYIWMKKWDTWKKPIKPQVVELPSEEKQHPF